MATFTQLDDSAVAAVASAFALGNIRSWAPIAAGTINSNFRLLSDAGQFFLRINEGKSEADVRYEAELVAELAAAGVPTPVPLRGADDAPFALLFGKYASVFPWVAGSHRCQAAVTPADTGAVGRALAHLHRAGAELAARYERPGIYTFGDLVRRFEGFRSSDDPALVDAIAAIEAEIAWLRERAELRDAAARGVIHADLFRDNVLFGEARVAALIDFEQACTGSFVYDLAVLINAWCFGEDFDPALVRAAIAGYRAVRELDRAERTALPVELRAAAMRFTVTRITDVHLQQTSATKDFRRYLRRLRSWQRLLGGPGLAGDAGLDGL